MHKAFIAAPLIGTIIFVTAVVFVVNINKAESNAVTQISQEAYHNRINSIVELYRSDAGSLFREDVKKVVEQALTSQCWSLFQMHIYDNDPSDRAEQKAEKLRKARFDSCNAIKSTVLSVICSNTGEDSGLGAANACSGLAGDAAAYANCLEHSGGRSRTYGLQNFFNNLNQEFSFEGIVLSPSNSEGFSSFFNPRDESTNSINLVQYISNCRNLVKELTIDCDAFAGTEVQAPRLQCCSVDTGDSFDSRSSCPSDKIIPGCENGIFYVKIVPSGSGVFENLPRIQAKDDAGNYLRVGAISDVEEFYLPITFPLMKYLNASFNAYSVLAFGQRIGENDGDAEGILDGVCHAGNYCTAADSGLHIAEGFTTFSGDNPFSTRDQAINNLAQVYYVHVFKPAFETLSPELEVSLLRGNREVARCKQQSIGMGELSCVDLETGASADDAVENILFSFVQSSPSDDNTRYYGYIPELTIDFKIIDTDPSFKVKPDAYNEFCTSAILDFNPGSS